MRRTHARRQHALTKFVESGDQADAVVVKRPSELLQEFRALDGWRNLPLFQAAIDFDKQLTGAASGLLKRLLANVKRGSGLSSSGRTTILPHITVLERR